MPLGATRASLDTSSDAPLGATPPGDAASGRGNPGSLQRDGWRGEVMANTSRSTRRRRRSSRAPRLPARPGVARASASEPNRARRASRTESSAHRRPPTRAQLAKGLCEIASDARGFCAPSRPWRAHGRRCAMRSSRGWPDSRTPSSGVHRGTPAAMETWRSDGAHGEMRRSIRGDAPVGRHGKSLLRHDFEQLLRVLFRVNARDRDTPPGSGLRARPQWGDPWNYFGRRE